jgi:hypothetical protein
VATINLGKDYTISSSLSNVSDLTLTYSGDTIDSTTRSGSKPVKHVETGLNKITLEATVLVDETTNYKLGQSLSVTSTRFTGSVIVADAQYDEPDDGIVSVKLTLTPGTASAEADQIDFI